MLSTKSWQNTLLVEIFCIFVVFFLVYGKQVTFAVRSKLFSERVAKFWANQLVLASKSFKAVLPTTFKHMGPK